MISEHGDSDDRRRNGLLGARAKAYGGPVLEANGPLYRTADAASEAPFVALHTGKDLVQSLPRLEAYLQGRGPTPLSRHPAWPLVLKRGLGHVPYCLEAVGRGQTQGFLALAYVRSFLFGRFLVSLPYLNYGGVVADDEASACKLIDRAVRL